MKILISRISFLFYSDSKFFDLIEKNKLSSVETNFNTKIKIKYKFNIHSIQSVFYNTKIKFDKNFLKKNIEHFQSVSEFAKKNNIKNINLGNFPSRKLTMNKKDLYILNSKIFSKFSKIAKKNKQIISIEPVTKKYGSKFLVNTFEVICFIKKLKKKNIKLLFDVGNIIENNQNLEKLFVKFENKINHVHISNVNLKNINYSLIKRVLNMLIQNKYKKTVSIEFMSNHYQKSNKMIKFLINNYKQYL